MDKIQGVAAKEDTVHRQHLRALGKEVILYEPPLVSNSDIKDNAVEGAIEILESVLEASPDKLINFIVSA
jgi:hypothetical protein